MLNIFFSTEAVSFKIEDETFKERFGYESCKVAYSMATKQWKGRRTVTLYGTGYKHVIRNES